MIKSIAAFFIVVSSTSTVFGATPLTRIQLDLNQFKSVADAVIKQQKIAENETVLSIAIKGKTFADKGGVSNNFVVQYVSADGKCTQEGVGVATVLPSNKTEVTFYRYPRQACPQADQAN